MGFKVLISVFFASMVVHQNPLTFANASSASKTIFIGSSGEFSCISSFPPLWSWSSKKGGKLKTLAYAGTQPHPSLKDDRFSFAQNKSTFVLKIRDVKASDAGNYNCQGDSHQQTVLNVVRYEKMFKEEE